MMNGISHTCYLSPDEPMHLVVPSCLQMGWCKSAFYFCTGSETAHDIGKTLTYTPVRLLPTHPLEQHLVPIDLEQNTPNNNQDDDNNDNGSITKFLHLLEVYIDGFIQLAQTTVPSDLLHLSCAYYMPYTPSPPSVTGGTK